MKRSPRMRRVPKGNRPTTENTRQLRAERSKLEALAAARKAAAPSKLRKRAWSDDRLQAVEDATLKAAGLFAAAKWDGGPWPDQGRALVRGATIMLAFEEWARAYGMRAPPVVEGYAELAGVLEEARGSFQALPLAALSPEYFGHVHETLVGYAVQDGRLVPNGGRRKMGAHFTPEQLARKVARRTIEPLLRVLMKDGAAGLGERVLALKICDPAVGAGAFPLSIVRLLAGVVRHSGPAETLDGAKRLIAIHVVHGVDADCYAVLACKLALTLECRADRMPLITWLDHAIKHGDALVGLNREQIKAFYWKGGESAIPELDELYDRAIDQAARATIAHREQLASQARHA